MLVLARRMNQRITIGDEVVVEVVDINGDIVRLGVTAPKSIQVHREEIYDALARERADDPTRHSITPTFSRQEAWLIVNHFKLLAANGSEVADGIVSRIEKIMQEKYA